MKLKIKDLIQGSEIIDILGDSKVLVEDFTSDSREIEANMMFVAIKGVSVDGHNFITKAIEKGATVIVCDELPTDIKDDVTYVKVKSTSVLYGQIASKYYNEPSHKLKLVGITGTNGKTTTATLLYDLFTKLGYKCGLISTVKYCVNDKVFGSTHTTPDAKVLNELLSQMVDVGCEFCFMEVSSHSIVQHRISGLTFIGGVFSNITHDHLDYHGTFKEYINAKKAFFDILPKKAFALYNVDDRNGEIMVQNCAATLHPYSVRALSPFKCRVVEMLPTGMLININSNELWVNFIGEFNAYNLLAVYATAICLNQSKQEVLIAMSELRSVSGRFDYVVSKDGITAIVDYAHTPDALEHVIESVNEIKPEGRKLITVVGCGGDRDKTKRPIMASIAVNNSDFTILTSDNPRSEDPNDILNDMTEGLKESIVSLKGKYVVIADRSEAIKMSIVMANSNSKGEGDMVLIAGKGHETYQEINGVKHYFDDKQEVLKHIEIK
ncbi:MAG: UDP-N-acetylmuramoyl-L-alanyl-D-glutamate--2,6-diaminopimelate ligase [Rikenellaceae bacterium]